MADPQEIWLPFLTILQEFHNGMHAKVVIGGRESDPFDVLVGVKQGCVMAPVMMSSLTFS